MSLVGNLEDLGLGDILQIVSLSRKSGVLSLQGRGREGRVYFQEGQVIQATSSVFNENIGDLLLRKGLIDVEILRGAVQVQKSLKEPVRLGIILSENFGISRQAIEDAVKEQVEKIVYSFFGWNEGAFSFELGEAGNPSTTSFDPLQFMLEKGLNPQWLAMEGSRILDEKKHYGESTEEQSGDSAEVEPGVSSADESVFAAESPPLSEAMGPPPVFLIDDDESTRDTLGRFLTERGCPVHLFDAADEFLAAVQGEVAAGGKPVLLIDLIIPRPDGDGILGGMELLQRVRERFPELIILMMSDHLNAEMERRVQDHGVSVLAPKPKREEVAEEAGLKALEDLADTVLAAIGPAPEASLRGNHPLYNLGAELLREMGEDEPDFQPAKGPESPGLHLLRGMLQELNNPSLGGGIILLVLRFASELMNRAVFFLVKGKEIVGLGQFGIELSERMADTQVRRMKIPRDDESVFTSVLEGMRPQKTRPGQSKWDAYLIEQLGGGNPQEIFLGPILSEGKVVAVIYGDNLPEQKPIGDTESLEIFLSQAGLAMEKALLERRLREREAV